MRLIVTVEHASNRIPSRYGDLGLPRKALTSHIAWDPGALELGGTLSEALDASLHLGEWSRLLVDLNRSASNRRVVPQRSFGTDIPGNLELEREEVLERIETNWRPFRQAALRSIEAAVAEDRSCLHLSVHTFTPELGTELRDYDLAVLYDPGRGTEREIGGELVRRWRTGGWAARRNAPYRGVADGHTTALRRQFPGEQYAGLEIEVNQRLLPKWSRATEAVVDAVRLVLEKQKARR